MKRASRQTATTEKVYIDALAAYNATSENVNQHTDSADCRMPQEYYLGMQFGGVRSTSQVANNFMGTGRVAGDVTFVRSAIFGTAAHKQTST